MWQLLQELRGERRTGPLGAHAVRGAGRHLGRRPQSLPAGRPARQSEAAGAAGRRAAPSAARDRQAAAAGDGRGQRARRQGRAPRGRGQRRRRPLRRVVRRDGGPAPPRAPRARAPHRPRQHRVRRPGARVARDRRDRLARRVPVRRPLSRRGGRGARPGRGLHRTRPHDHPARRRHRLHGRRDSARRAVGGDQHREVRAAVRRRAGRAARARASPCRRSKPAPAWSRAA